MAFEHVDWPEARQHEIALVLAGGLGATLQTGRTLDYREDGDENRKMRSLYLSLIDRMGIKLDSFGDSDTSLEGL